MVRSHRPNHSHSRSLVSRGCFERRPRYRIPRILSQGATRMGILGTLLLLFVLPPVEDNPVAKVPLGKDTTVAMGPLDKAGYIDYEAALNERLGKGITPEKNANVLIWQALGPKPE